MIFPLLRLVGKRKRGSFFDRSTNLCKYDKSKVPLSIEHLSLSTRGFVLVHLVSQPVFVVKKTSLKTTGDRDNWSNFRKNIGYCYVICLSLT